MTISKINRSPDQTQNQQISEVTESIPEGEIEPRHFEETLNHPPLEDKKGKTIKKDRISVGVAKIYRAIEDEPIPQEIMAMIEKLGKGEKS